MYHSWWFLALLGLFSINITACSIKRFPRVWKTVHEPVLTADDGLFRTFSNTEELLVKDSPEAARDKLCALFAKQFAPATVTERDGKIHLFAQKGKYARFGVYVTHASILIIFAGAIIGTIWGYKAYVNIVEGTQTTKVWPRGSEQPLELGFAVRCDAFSVAFYEGSQRPKEFASELVVLENGQEVLKKRIVVNHPLQYKGITFYQSSYGPAGDPGFRFRVQERASGESVEVNARQGQPVALPGGGSFIVSNFAPSYQNFGPAAQLQMVGGDGRGGAFLVFQNHPEFDAQRGGDYIFSLIEAKQRYYTGLQVAKDPGVWVVWLGCAMLIFG
ncbi:MAG: cytochrome c biogenesis protein ResB, partial [Trichloromonadaceae bacterium]